MYNMPEEGNKNSGIDQREKSSSKIESDYIRQLQKKYIEIENKASKLVRYSCFFNSIAKIDIDFF